MTRELVPLKPFQESMTRLPRFLTELPFFYLTKKASALTEPINFRTEDSDGRPVNWKVHPNFGDAVGPPSLMAHEVWVRLIKPCVDRQRSKFGFIPSLIPLGGVRECLRLLGWSYGGHQARSLIKSINQIGGAWCEASLWLPTRETENDGKPVCRLFQANFSRLSLYAIGANHLTEEDIRNARADFSFELDDVLYIKLDPMEMRMLDAGNDRPIDNEYLFSLSPAARRWYELIAPKFFGVISNSERGRGYCDIRYSWYVGRHHTLKKHTSRKRIVQQLNEIIEEHVQFGFVQKVEYQSLQRIREGNGSEDMLVRYYPGKFAVRVTRRVSESLRPRPTAGRVRRVGIVTVPADEEAKRLEKELTRAGVSVAKASDLVRDNRDSVDRQLHALRYRERSGIRDLGAWLVRAIEENFELPEPLLRAIESENARRRAIEKMKMEEARSRHEQQFREDYSTYLETRAEIIQRDFPDDYLAFLSATADERNRNDRFLDSSDVRRVLSEHLFSDFFRTHEQVPVLDFWVWDARINQKSFPP